MGMGMINHIGWNVLLYLGLCIDREYHSGTINACQTSNLSFCNRALIKTIPQATELNALQNFMGNRPYTLWIPSDSDVESEIKKNTFFMYSTSFPIMALAMASLMEHTSNDCIVVRQVHTAEELDLWINIVTNVYNIQNQEFRSYIMYLESISRKDRITYWIGYWKGQPVAGSMFIMENSVVGVHWVATLPDFRNQGIGFAVTYNPLVHLKKRGAEQAVLFSSTMGKPVYEKMGFKTVLHCSVYKTVLTN